MRPEYVCNYMKVNKITEKKFFFCLIDAEFEVVVMANRHIPPKCIAIGKWDDPGEFKH